MPCLTYFFQNHIYIIFKIPLRIMGLEFSDIGDIPDVVADAILRLIFIYRLFMKNLFHLFYSLKDREVGLAASSGIVNFPAAGILSKMPEHIHQIKAVDIIPHLLSFITEDGIFNPCSHTFNQISQEPVQLGSAMRRPGKTSPAEDAGL